jgi:hypothetical protein
MSFSSTSSIGFYTSSPSPSEQGLPAFLDEFRTVEDALEDLDHTFRVGRFKPFLPYMLLTSNIDRHQWIRDSRKSYVLHRLDMAIR